MGAYSSWAMLDIMHHALIQFASVRATGGFTVSYRVLGDDSTIGGQAVAHEYLRVMKEFNIPINLDKSIISPTGLIKFANQVVLRAVNLSPLSLKEEIAINSVHSRLAFAARAMDRGYGEVRSRLDLGHNLPKDRNRLSQLLICLTQASQRSNIEDFISLTVSCWSQSMIEMIRLALGPSSGIDLGLAVPRWHAFYGSLRPNKSDLRADNLQPFNLGSVE
jgi:hypothetical protein